MKVIRKFHLVLGENTLQMPEGAEVLYTDIDGNGLKSIWAIVDDEARKVERHFFVIPTDHPFSDYWRIQKVGSIREVIALGQVFFWHVFEVLP